MPSESALPLVAVDVGNSRLKFGDFEHPPAEPIPHPNRTLSIGHDWQEQAITSLLPRPVDAYAWCIASVNRPAAKRLVDWLSARGVAHVRVLASQDLPLTVDVPLPDRVGMDRLVNAVAANRLRKANEPAIIVDIGSAITVDLISQSGAFSGGAILPGIALSARALHEYTDLLPLVEVSDAPTALGRSTLSAISSGLYWGTVGAVRHLAKLLIADKAQIFLTGGAAPPFANTLADDDMSLPHFVPHLTLAGIALAAVGRAAKV